MVIEGLRSMTVGELLKDEKELKEVTYNAYNSQVILKDGIFTVRSLRKLAGFDTLVWGT